MHGMYSKISEVSNFMKGLPVGAELFHVDGRTDRQVNRRRDEANSHFSQFYERIWNM